MEDYMRRVSWIIPVVLIVCGAGLLKADDPPAVPAAPGTSADAAKASNEQLKAIERYTAMVHDPEAAAVSAIFQANELLKAKGGQVAIDYFQKKLYETKNRAVARAIRLELAQLYKENGQTDQAMDQLGELMTETDNP
jgi:predicted negative regulator of RcsB-dependent stress response